MNSLPELSQALGGTPLGGMSSFACPHWFLWDLPPFLIRGFHTSRSLLFRKELEALRNTVVAYCMPNLITVY